MTSYTHLTEEERIEIERFHHKGFSCRTIAKLLSRHHSTIARELNRNTSSWRYGYTHHKAHERAKNRVKQRTASLFKDQEMQAFVIQKLREDSWSPGTISGRLKKDHPDKAVCTETIYRFIYNTKIARRLKLWQYLVRQHKNRIPFGKRNKKQSKIPNLTPIHDRSISANKREEIGHWEGDLILNKGGNVAVLLERKSRLMIAIKNPSKHAELVMNGIELSLMNLPAKLKQSMTFDRGLEFARHENLQHSFKMKTYFCDAYSPWQKGGVENANGRLRRFIPKGADISALTQKNLERYIEKMNNTPRACLGYKTPLEYIKPYLNECRASE